MLTLKRRRKRRVPPQRGRGAILGRFSYCAQSSTLAVAVSGSPKHTVYYVTQTATGSTQSSSSPTGSWPVYMRFEMGLSLFR